MSSAENFTQSAKCNGGVNNSVIFTRGRKNIESF